MTRNNVNNIVGDKIEEDVEEGKKAEEEEEKEKEEEEEEVD